MKKRNVLIIGAGGIVSDAHLPAYKKANFEVLGIYDPDIEKAKNEIEKEMNIILKAIKTSKVVQINGDDTLVTWNKTRKNIECGGFT